MPFEVVGAPWIEPQGLAEALNALGLPRRAVRAGDVHADGRRLRQRARAAACAWW